MGKLVEQSIKTLFNGVSRQPATVRHPNQVEEGDNILPSVVTGGFEKRPASQHIAVVGTLDPAVEYRVHLINRDETERYFVVIGDGEIQVIKLADGTACTVTDPDGWSYINADPHKHQAATVADYTFITNTEKVVAMASAGAGSVAGTVQVFGDLPSASTHSGDIYRVAGDEATAFDDYYVQSDGSVWNETVKPDEVNAFDTSTMPWQLVRTAVDTFEFRKAVWLPRQVGDPDSVPEPEFVGHTINDIFFRGGRVGVLSDEYAILTQAGDVFNFWPEKAFQELDTDPVILSAQTDQVSILKYGVPFRKNLFVTANEVQFEVSADSTLTPKTSALDVTTSYQIDHMCRPARLGDQLYFVGAAQNAAVVYEYYYDADAFSNTAADVTKHCHGYVPSDIRMLTTSSLAGRAFLVPDEHRNHIYVYTSYWNGTEKVQSAWVRYILGETEDDAYIYGAAVVGDSLYLLVARDTEVTLEKIPVDTEADDEDLGFAPLYDRRVELTGSYDAVNGWTTWTTPYHHHDDVKILLGGGFTGKKGRILNVTYPSSTTVRAVGDFSSSTVYAGIEYEERAEISPQYMRDQQGVAMRTGRLQMKNITFSFKNTGYFEVHVTPKARDTKVWKMTGHILGDASFTIGSPTILENGTYTAKVGSKGDTVKIEVVNSSPYPSVITGATWRGFYNNIVLQG